MTSTGIIFIYQRAAAEDHLQAWAALDQITRLAKLPGREDEVARLEREAVKAQTSARRRARVARSLLLALGRPAPLPIKMKWFIVTGREEFGEDTASVLLAKTAAAAERLFRKELKDGDRRAVIHITAVYECDTQPRVVKHPLWG